MLGYVKKLYPQPWLQAECPRLDPNSKVLMTWSVRWEVRIQPT